MEEKLKTFPNHISAFNEIFGSRLDTNINNEYTI